MIDKDAFIAGIAVLAGAFSREVDAPVQRAYYAVLSPQMTTEEFEKAVALTLTSETFWPSPAVLLSKVKKGDEGKGLLALEHVTRIVDKAGGFRFLPHATYLAEFDAPTRAAISVCGGLVVITNTSEERWPAMQRKFAAAYTQALNPKPALSAPPTDARVKQLVASTADALTSGRDRAAGRDE